VYKMAHYQKFFEDADADGSGFLSESELIEALRKNGYSGDDDKIKVRTGELSLVYRVHRMLILWV